MSKSKKFTTANKTQLSLMQTCLDNLIANCKEINDYFECSIESQNVYDFNGALTFILKKNAKDGTGMLFMLDKSWLVKIGRRGKVSSLDTCDRDSKMKPNNRLYFA
jgi:hypothetical protein